MWRLRLDPQEYVPDSELRRAPQQNATFTPSPLQLPIQPAPPPDVASYLSTYPPIAQGNSTETALNVPPHPP